MTGTGTQADPYLVDNIADFRTAYTQENVYVKLTADLNCNAEGYLRWYGVPVKAKEIDFNGFSLIAPYIASTSVLFNANGYNTVFKNGNILNVFEDNANVGCAYIYFYNMGITIHATGFNYEVFNLCYFEGCNVEINYANSKKKKWFAAPIDGTAGLIAVDSRFYINGKISSSDYYGAFMGNSGKDVLRGCRIEGKLAPVEINSSTYYMAFGNLSNCVVNVDMIAFSSGTGNYYISDKGINSIYNKDIVNDAKFSGGIACTTEEVLDPESNNSKGFIVVEKTS